MNTTATILLPQPEPASLPGETEKLVRQERFWLRAFYFVAGAICFGGIGYILGMFQTVQRLRTLGILSLCGLLLAAEMRAQEVQAPPFKLLSTENVTNDFCLIEGLLVVGICLAVSSGYVYAYISLHHSIDAIASNRLHQMEAAMGEVTEAAGQNRTVPAQVIVGKVVRGPWAATLEATTNFSDWFPLASFSGPGDGTETNRMERVVVPAGSSWGFRLR